MKIAIITYTMDRKAMGTALYTRELVENLLQVKRPEDEVFLIHREKNSDPLYQRGREVIMPKVNLPRFSHLISEALFLWRTRHDFDIIHYPQESIYPIFWLSRAKIVITMHSAAEGWRDYSTLRRRWWLVYLTLTFLKNKISAVICSSNSTKLSVKKNFDFPEPKLHVVHLGVGDLFRQALTREVAQKIMIDKYQISSPYILNGSRVDPHKNIQRTVLAFAGLKRDLKLTHKLVIGAKHLPEESRKVDQLVHKLSLEKDIIFMPYIESEDMPALYAAADLFVFPSLHEGFGLPVLEAMAMATPVVTSNLFSLPEVAGDTALLVDPEKVEEISLAMRRLLTNETLRRNLSILAQQRSRAFSWRRMAEGTNEVYSTLRVA